MGEAIRERSVITEIPVWCMFFFLNETYKDGVMYVGILLNFSHYYKDSFYEMSQGFFRSLLTAHFSQFLGAFHIFFTNPARLRKGDLFPPKKKIFHNLGNPFYFRHLFWQGGPRIQGRKWG